MPENIVEMLSSYAPCEVSFKLDSLAGDEIFSHRADIVTPSASTIKVLVMAEIMRLVQEGVLTLDQRVIVPEQEKLNDSLIGVLAEESFLLGDLVRLMIVISDNTATNVIIDIAEMSAVNRLAATLGLSSTSLQRKMLDWEAVKAGRQNYTSSRDLNTLFGMIARGELPGSEFMLATLLNQKHSSYFRKYLPEEARVAHKPGSLDRLAHDAGILYLDSGTYLWSVLVPDADNVAAAEYISRSTREVYDYLTGLPAM